MTSHHVKIAKSNGRWSAVCDCTVSWERNRWSQAVGNALDHQRAKRLPVGFQLGRGDGCAAAPTV